MFLFRFKVTSHLDNDRLALQLPEPIQSIVFETNTQQFFLDAWTLYRGLPRACDEA